MKKCNLVINSLETYSNNKTDKYTNEFIEKHILKCKECKNKLLELENGKSKLDNLTKKQEKKYKAILLIFVSIFILLVFLFISCYKNPTSIIHDIKMSDAPLKSLYHYLSKAYEEQDLNYTTIFEYRNPNNQSHHITISIFDENDYWVECQNIEIFKTSKEAQDYYSTLSKYTSKEEGYLFYYSELSISDNIITYDTNLSKAMTIDLFYKDLTPIISKDQLLLILK